MRPVLLIASSLILATALPIDARAQWPSGYSYPFGANQALNGAVDGRFVPGETPDDFYAMICSQGSAIASRSWQVAHLSTQGASLWSTSSVTLQMDKLSGPFLGPGFAPRGDGGYLNPFLATVSGHSQALLSVADNDGVPSPSSAPFGTYLSNSSNGLGGIQACRSPGGGGFVAWILNDMRLVRLDTQGAVAPGWPVGGWRPNPHVIDNGFPQLAMTEDGEGGALVGFNSPGGAAVIRFAGSDTTVAPGWPATGLVLTQTGSWYLQSHMELIRADDTHFVAVWQDWQNGRITAQRFSLSGSLDPNWPANGAAISDSLWDVSLSLHAVPDGAGGVTVVWSGNGGQTIRHVLADGSFPGAYAGGPLAVTGRALVRGRDDGVCILGADLAVSGGVWARWLDGQGHAPDCPSGDCPVTLVPAHDGYLPNAIAGMPDGAGGVYFAYEAYGDSSGPQGHIYRYFISHADYLGIPVNAVPGLPTREALSLSLSPNPSAGPFTARFTLPDAEPARLEVLDLAGRRVASRDVAGAGFHMEAFLEVDRLKSGVYLVRLSSRSARAFARVALVR